MVWCGPVGLIDGNGRSLTTVPTSLTDDDLAWINGQLDLVGERAIRCDPAELLPDPRLLETVWR
jgi:hypothetical protein